MDPIVFSPLLVMIEESAFILTLSTLRIDLSIKWKTKINGRSYHERRWEGKQEKAPEKQMTRYEGKGGNPPPKVPVRRTATSQKQHQPEKRLAGATQVTESGADLDEKLKKEEPYVHPRRRIPIFLGL